jgi:FkbM family methyltransferase
VSWFLAAPFERAHYVALWNMIRVYPRPAENFRRYVFLKGGYPYRCRLRTPVGEVGVDLYGPADMLTVNEVFCRLDYAAPANVQTIVDIGSNIGVSALYFLTRNPHSHVHAFEPNPANVSRLRGNLSAFEGRYELDESAVSDFEGTVEFGIERTGRYGGIGQSREETISVMCRDINNVLEEVLAGAGTIDVLKIDTEGHELRTVQAIRRTLLRRIRVIYFETEEPAPRLHTDLFTQSRRLSCERLVLRDA